MPVHIERLTLLSVLDGKSREMGQVKIGECATVTCWVAGLAENSDRANTSVWLDGQKLRVEYMGESVPAEGGGTARQVNAVLPPDATPGEYDLHVECAGVSTDIATVRLV
jgi:uncharacterized protein (TIGR03437 family)